MQKADNTPPKAVQAACRRGLDAAEEFGGPGLTDGAKARARSMAAGEPVSDDSLQRMSNFFSRHQQNRADPNASEPTPGAVAWLLWGGDAGKRWADSKTSGDQAEKSHHTRDFATGKYGPRKANKAGTPKYKREGLVAPGGAWAEAKRQAKKRGKGDDYASAIFARITGKRK